jgi:hypothetical protein
MIIFRESFLAVAVSMLAMTGALAQGAMQPNEPIVSGPPPALQENCLIKTLRACKADGSCSPLDNLKGEKLPVKMTADLAVGIIAGVDPDGWVDASRIISLARTDDELILQGVDGAVAWQLLIYEKDQVMSFSLATGDTTTAGYGTCSAVKGP